MAELLTAAQMRAIEEAAIASGKVTGLELMERAGAGVVEAIFEEWPQLSNGPHRAVVLCGPGNNGGDGFVVAQLLHERGWDVAVFLYGDPQKLPPDAKTNCTRWRKRGSVRTLNGDAKLYDAQPDVVIDAIFGVGLSRPLKSTVLDIATDAMGFAAIWYDVAIDMPTGLHSDTGAVLGAVFPAELTVTFHRAKVGHFVADGPASCGKVVVKDIGL